MKKQREFRTITTGASSKVDGNTLSGYIALFNSLSEDLGGFKEVLKPGCFTSSLRNDIPALINHNTSTVVGRSSVGTLKLTQDNIGLAYSIDLPDTSAARDLKVSTERGDLSGCSFGFFCTDSDWNADGSLRTVNDVDMFEVSVGVTFPAYEATSMQLRALFPDGLIKRSNDPSCACDCSQCQAGSCGICSDPDCDDPACDCNSERSVRSLDNDPHKTVDGEVLHADAFLIVLNSKDPATWNLPWKFSTEEKTVSHLRDALARFDQLEDVPAADKKAAWDKLVDLCKKHDIDVSPDDTREWKLDFDMRLRLAKLRARI